MKKRSHKLRILNLLKDGRWYSTSELAFVYYKFTQRLPDLTEMGIEWVKIPDTNNPNQYLYMLTSDTMDLLYNSNCKENAVPWIDDLLN